MLRKQMFRQQSGAFSARGCLLSSQCVGCHAGRHIGGRTRELRGAKPVLRLWHVLWGRWSNLVQNEGLVTCIHHVLRCGSRFVVSWMTSSRKWVLPEIPFNNNKAESAVQNCFELQKLWCCDCSHSTDEALPVLSSQMCESMGVRGVSRRHCCQATGRAEHSLFSWG